MVEISGDKLVVEVQNKMKFIIGKKVEMTQRFAEDGNVVPCTVIQAGPCFVVQVKNAERDGYQAVQIGFEEKKKLIKPEQGHLESLPRLRYLKEFRVDNPGDIKRGQKIDVSVFKPGDAVEVEGVSKGKGFQGVMKRHGFKGGPGSHGNKDQARMPGSVGPTEPQHVFKGVRMAGRMGGEQVTVKNLKVVEVEKDKNLIFINGAVPGARHGLVLILGEGEMALAEPVKFETKVEEKPAAKKAKSKTEETEKKVKKSKKDDKKR